jgi:hypothetical protein
MEQCTLANAETVVPTDASGPDDDCRCTTPMLPRKNRKRQVSKHTSPFKG